MGERVCPGDELVREGQIRSPWNENLRRNYHTLHTQEESQTKWFCSLRERASCFDLGVCSERGVSEYYAREVGGWGAGFTKVHARCSDSIKLQNIHLYIRSRGMRHGQYCRIYQDTAPYSNRHLLVTAIYLQSCSLSRASHKPLGFQTRFE